MKKIISSIVLLLCIYNAIAQDNVIWSGNGITFSYSLETDGTIENPETGTKFTWYKVITQVSNATNKDMMVNSAQVYCKLNSARSELNESDNRFCAERNNTGIFHGQLCRFNIICSNTTVRDIPKYLICPQGEMPAIEYYAIQAGELDQNAEVTEEQNHTPADEHGDPIVEKEEHVANNPGGGYGEFSYQGTGYSGTCSSKSLYDFCDGGSISVSINTNERDLWIYNMPQSAGGTFSISNGTGDNCELKFILPYFDDAGKYSYSSSESGTLAKTSSTSFTFTCKLASGETITGSGNYGDPGGESDPAEEQQSGSVSSSVEEDPGIFLIENKNQPGINTTASGLQYQVLSQGTGPRPVSGDRVSVRYQGSLTNGDIIAVQDEPVVLPVNEVIAGWQEGLQLMPVGSRYKFFIPADLAYGDSGAGSIMPGATVIFEIELLEIIE